MQAHTHTQTYTHKYTHDRLWPPASTSIPSSICSNETSPPIRGIRKPLNPHSSTRCDRPTCIYVGVRICMYVCFERAQFHPWYENSFQSVFMYYLRRIDVCLCVCVWCGVPIIYACMCKASESTFSKGCAWMISTYVFICIV
jgi:hypothetical protein